MKYLIWLGMVAILACLGSAELLGETAPVADPGTLGVTAGTTATGTLTGSDAASLPLTFALASPPSLGSVVLVDASAGTFTYTPNPGALGSDTFTFTASDGTMVSTPAAISVTITTPTRSGLDLEWTSISQGADGDPVTALACDPSNDLMVANLTSYENSAMLWDPQWPNAFLGGWWLPTDQVGGGAVTIRALAATPSGSALATIYAGGDFTLMNSSNVYRIGQAMIQPAPTTANPWSPTIGIGPVGYNASAGTAVGADNSVYAIAADLGHAYFGGAFGTVGGVTTAHVACWDGTTVTALGLGCDGLVRALVVDRDGSVIAGGDFTTAGGVSAPGLARWSGGAWSAIGGGVHGSVYALALDAQDDVIVGGSFTSAGAVTVSDLACWNGSAWSTMGGGANAPVRSLCADGATLYAGGDFTSIGGASASYVATWNGSVWSALGSGVNATVNAIAVDGLHDIYVGGNFTTAGGQSDVYLALFQPNPMLSITAQAAGALVRFTVVFNVPVSGLTAGDVSCANGTVESITGSGTSYTVTVIPAAPGTVTLTVASGAATGADGYVSTPGSASLLYEPPSNSVPPSITGSAVVGATATAQPGSWSASDGASLSFNYQWFVAPTSSGAGASSLGTGATLTYPANAAGQYVQVVVTAIDPFGTSAQAASSWVAVHLPATPVITWNAPAAFVYGAALSTTQLDATASVPGTFAYTPAASAVLHAGANQTLSVIFTPSDQVDYVQASANVTLTVTAAPLTITAANAAMTAGAVALPPLSANYSGFVNGDSSASLTTPPSLSTTATTASPPGTYAIVASGASNPDYLISYVSGVMTVSAASTTGSSTSGTSGSSGTGATTGSGGTNSSPGGTSSGTCGLGVGGMGALWCALLGARALLSRRRRWSTAPERVRPNPGIR
jgi:hypothetical protein